MFLSIRDVYLNITSCSVSSCRPHSSKLKSQVFEFGFKVRNEVEGLAIDRMEIPGE